MENIIEQIHHDFKTSYLKTYSDICEIIKDEFKIKNNYERAIELGFHSQPELEKYRLSKEKHKESLELLDTIKRFKIDYPNKKFITFKDAADIIFKYGLVISTPDRFVGEFPEKNINDMINFQLKENDINIMKSSCTDLFITNQPEDRLTLRYKTKIALEDLIIIDYINPINHFVKGITLEENINEIITNPFNYINNTKFLNYNRNLGYFPFKNNNLDKSEIHFDKDKFMSNLDMYTNKDKFLVIGTPDQFMMKSNERVINGQIVELKDDPIIVKPVRHGFIIVTAWGDEAQLPEVMDITQN